MDWPWHSLLNSEPWTSSIAFRFRSSRGSLSIDVTTGYADHCYLPPETFWTFLFSSSLFPLHVTFVPTCLPIPGTRLLTFVPCRSGLLVFVCDWVCDWRSSSILNLTASTWHRVVACWASLPRWSFFIFILWFLRPAGGVKHSDSDLVETGMLSAKKALRWIEGSILSNSRKF